MLKITKMPLLNIIWGKIKEYWRNEFHQSEIYCDENENIIVFNHNDNSTIIIGYLHATSKYASFVSSTREFIDYIKKSGSINYRSYKIYMLCNYRLCDFGPSSDIRTLPSDVEYFFVDYNPSYDTINIKSENLINAEEVSDHNNQPWYYRKGIEVITDSKFKDWEKWEIKGYNREWYDFNQIDEFEATWNISTMISADEIYVDERLLGFYIVWKLDSFDY
jgi:hypothetical protein